MKRTTFNKLLLFFIGAVIWWYFRMINIILSSHTESNSSYSPAMPTALGKPPLQNYIQGWNITGNVNWLLDFSIVGFPKTGTSTLMLYLKNQSQSVFMFSDERCEMGWNQHVPLLVDLYHQYQPHLRMGIKCPHDLEVDLALNNYNEFFPATKFIVGLRHPILWFQSFYNFRITNGYNMPPAERLIGRCKRSFQGVCTFRANFSKHLEKIEPFRKVFLYDVSQLQDHDTARSALFLQDLGEFLDLPEKLEQPMLWIKPGQNPVSTEEEEVRNGTKINICEGQYANLRTVLLEQASRSAYWIRNVFMANPNVKVSSQVYFSKLIDSWRDDPCNSKS